MSHHTLQRVVVRLLYDPRFVAALYADPDAALADLDLTQTERGYLLATDRRAWGYDPLRRRRSMRTLAEEFKTTTTLVLAETRSLATLDDFFSNPVFHAAIQAGGSLAGAFGTFLARLIAALPIATPNAAEVLRFEATLAACRRARPEALPPVPTTIDDTAIVRLAPGNAVGSFPSGVLDTVQAVEQYLFEVGLMPAVALCDDAPPLRLPPPASGKRYFHFAPGATDVTVLDLTKHEYLVLFETRQPAAIRDVLRRAATAGVPAKTALDIVSDALENHTLVLKGITA